MIFARTRWLSIWLVAVFLPASARAQTFVQIAREFEGGLMWLDADVRPAIAEDGTVAFAGSHDFAAYDATRIYVGDGGALTTVALGALSSPVSVEINDADQIAIVALRSTAMGTYRGAYTATTAGGGWTTRAEGRVSGGDPSVPPAGYNVAMSPNGTLAWSTIRDGNGAISRSPFSGAATALRTGSGTFYNTGWLAVNDAGLVAAQMEYGDPTAGLRRAILMFDAPGQPLASLATAVERMSISTQPVPSINSAGRVAFALNSTETMVFFTPPGVSGTVLEEVVLAPGVYVVTPGTFGVPKHRTRIAGLANGFTRFGRALINDAGEVAFEAAANGEWGVFVGSSPTDDKVLATGDVRGNQLYSVVQLGDLNNAGDIALMTSDYRSTDRQIWRVEGAFEAARARRAISEGLKLLLERLRRFPTL